MTPQVAELAEFVAGLDRSGVPGKLQAVVGDHVLDTLGCVVAAVGGPSWIAITDLVADEGGHPQASAAGLPIRVTVRQAAQVNGVLARSLEFDDMAMPDLHPSGVVVPALLAVAEHRRSTGAELLAAVVAALEVLVRLGRAGYDPDTRASRFLRHGQDASAICGSVAAAAGAARLLGLPAAQIGDAMGIAVTMAAGSLEANRSGGSVKQFNSGWAASAAVVAASLAARGVTGPRTALEGRYGFYECFVGGAYAAQVLVGALGERWEIDDLRYKPYPSNYYTHAGIDAALALRERGVRAGDVASIRLGVATAMLHTMGEPLELKQRPADAYAAKFSGPFTMAAALLGGGGLGVGTADFTDELARDPARRALMARIRVEADVGCDAIFPDHAPAVVEVDLVDGTRWQEKVLVNWGSQDRPLMPPDVARKFRGNTADRLAGDAAGELLNLLAALPDVADVGEIGTLLRAAGAGATA